MLYHVTLPLPFKGTGAVGMGSVLSHEEGGMQTQPVFFLSLPSRWNRHTVMEGVLQGGRPYSTAQGALIIAHPVGLSNFVRAKRRLLDDPEGESLKPRLDGIRSRIS